MVTKESTVVRSRDLLMSSVDDEAVLLGIKSGMYYGLNPIGSKIWELLSSKIRVSDLIAQLVENYEADEKQITSEVLAFLDQLLSRSLIELTHESDS